MVGFLEESNELKSKLFRANLLKESMKSGVVELRKQATNNYKQNHIISRKYHDLIGRMTNQEKAKFGVND